MASYIHRHVVLMSVEECADTAGLCNMYEEKKTKQSVVVIK